ncbi:MAG: radical SAM protein [Patescibacteria group bacterium]
MILPVGLNCNMTCSYCYHAGKNFSQGKFHRMPDEIIWKTIFESSQLAKNVDFLWHGGEPLMVGINHFKKAVQIEKEINFAGRVRNMIQTNGVLLTQAFCDFFAKENFKISTSIDGTKKINDTNRCFANGKGTYDKVKKAINLWRATGNNIGAIVLVTKANVNHPAEVYRGIKRLNLTSCAFHFCSQNEKCLTSMIPGRKETFEFFRSVFDKWFENDDPSFPIRNFRNAIRVLCGGKPLDCASMVDGCRGFIAVSENGDVYPCHRFVSKNEFLMGNIHYRSLSEIYENATHEYDRICSLSGECKSCKWLEMCGGGCAYERFVTNGAFNSVHPECSIKKMIFRHIEKKTSSFI